MRLHYSKDGLRSTESFLVLLIRSGKLQMTKIMTLLIFNGNACKLQYNYQSCSRVPRNILQTLMGQRLPFSAIFVIWLFLVLSRMFATRRGNKNPFFFF